MTPSKPTITTPVQKNISARHRSSCALADGKKRCTCDPAFLVKIGVGPRTKQKRITRTFGTLVEAQRWLLDNAQADAADGGQSLGRLLLRFQTNVETGSFRDKHGKVYKQSTAKEYLGSIGLLCTEYPEVLRRPVDVILRSDLQHVIDGLAATRSPQRVRNIMNPVRVVLSEATRDGLIRSNPMTDLRWPAKRAVAQRVVDFEADEETIDRLEPPLQVLYALALYGGLRRGEAMGLRWGSVDLDAGVLKVVEAFTHNAFTAPKSAAGRREVPIAAKLIRILRGWKEVCAKKGNDFVTDAALVLAGDTSPDRPIAESTIRRMAREQSAPTQIHALRHSFATMLARSGVGMKEAQLVLGHSDAKVTMDIYQHASTGMMERVRERLDDGFGTNVRLDQSEAETEAWDFYRSVLDEENWEDEIALNEYVANLYARFEAHGDPLPDPFPVHRPKDAPDFRHYRQG
jgi:integrase